MTVLVVTHPACLDHDTGDGHPERAGRLAAVRKGMATSGLDGALVEIAARRARPDELTRVHPVAYVDALERFCRAGGGSLDPDTPVVPASYDAALHAAGAGLDAIHHRHLDVHQHEVEAARRDGLDSQRAVIGERHLIAQPLQHLAAELAVGLVVIDEQDATLAPAVEAEGIRCIVTNTIMSTPEITTALARTCIEAVS